tara:strand:- start:1770 stop:2219 length:450 start_codon:yes stop_codon:yes gene_type:complete
MKKYLLFFVGIFLLLLIIKSGFSLFAGAEMSIVTADDKHDLKIEVADSDYELSQGLMGRKHLSENKGMLFVFGEEEQHRMWMKDTLIPLDMIFIAGNFKIVGIEHAYPCLEDPCKVYDVERDSKYVLEVKGNYTVRNDINVGDRVNIYN